MAKKRIDTLLMARELVQSQKEAVALLMARKVRVNDVPVTVPGMQVDEAAEIVVQHGMPYVSRGGFKLAAGLDAFEMDPTGWICADVGASTGGFCDVLLQRNVSRIYAIDVGYGILAWKIRQDPNVVVMERTNARKLKALPEMVDLVVIDASFISLKTLLPVVRGWLKPAANLVTLVKPQFEAKPDWVQPGGVIRDPAIHRRILADMIAWVEQAGFFVRGLTPSPITGPAGNREFLLHLALTAAPQTRSTEALITTALND